MLLVSGNDTNDNIAEFWPVGITPNLRKVSLANWLQISALVAVKPGAVACLAVPTHLAFLSITEKL